MIISLSTFRLCNATNTNTVIHSSRSPALHNVQASRQKVHTMPAWEKCSSELVQGSRLRLPTFRRRKLNQLVPTFQLESKTALFDQRNR